MSAAPGTGSRGAHPTLFQHAQRLHRLTPDRPLPRGGKPFPGPGDRYRPPPPGTDRTPAGVELAALLDAYFAHPTATPRALAGRLRGLPVEYRHNEHVSAAAARAPAARARATGRWLIRHGTDFGAVCTGLALLAEAGTADDIPRIQTIGLLANTCGPLAVQALERLPGGVEALLWLVERLTEWGRVEAVLALCRRVDEHPAVRPWLLRRAAAEGEFLNSYVIDVVMRVIGFHEAVVEHADDVEVLDHAGRVLRVMTYSEGMGESLRYYPHALTVLEAYLGRLGRLGPTPARRSVVDSLVPYLGEEVPVWSDTPAVRERWDAARTACLRLQERWGGGEIPS